MLNLNKFIFSFILLPLTGIITGSRVANAEMIRTKNFEIQITRHCVEGNISCDRVTYIGKDLNTGKSIRLNGTTVNSGHSYRFLGYEFRNGKYRYSVSNSNLLRVYQGQKLILEEQGESIDN